MLTYVLVHGAWSGAHGESLSAITGGSSAPMRLGDPWLVP